MTLFFTLVMTAIVCIALGCGIPTTANYLIMVTIAAPALAVLGVPQLVSHFFVFYYGVLADITPPVALAAYAGASMAGADPFKTGNTAFRLGLAKALVPFVFVYSPSMLLVTKGFTWAEFWETTIGCAIGVVMLAVALTGYGLARMPNWERLWLGAASILVISPNRTATLVGLAMAVPMLIPAAYRLAGRTSDRKRDRQEGAVAQRSSTGPLGKRRKEPESIGESHGKAVRLEMSPTSAQGEQPWKRKSAKSPTASIASRPTCRISRHRLASCSTSFSCSATSR